MRDPIASTVVKLGGSFALSPDLAAWLDMIAGGAGHVVLVPGGGPFADAVRDAQPAIGFDDAAAHHMALLAMEQYGRALVSRDPRLAPAGSASAMRRILADRRVPVWFPTRMALCAADIPASWDVTSDSLAAWLAHRIGAQRLLLIKQVAPTAGPTDLQDLMKRGILDRAFASFLPAGLELSIIGPDQRTSAAALLQAGP
jgi:dihydroneopterin aldolase